jgi:phosphatidylglycerophosphate synthase
MTAPHVEERLRPAKARPIGFVDAPREHHALTAGIEKRALVWLARHTPAAISPDHLTALGLAAQLARVRNQQRPRYGFYVDHISDTFGALALMAGLASSGLLHWPVAAGLLLCYYALSIETYLATYTLGRFHLSHGMLGPTEIRILLAIGNLVAYWHPYSVILGRRLLLFDVGGSVAIAGMAIMFLIVSMRHTAALYRMETLR